MNRSRYIVTMDLGAQIQCLRGIGLNVPKLEDRFFTDFHSGLVDRLGKLLPDIDIVSMDMTDLAAKIWDKSLKTKDSIKDAMVVSSCIEMAQPRRGHVFEINRIADLSGKIIGIGPRPGHPSVSDQFDALASAAKGRSIVLAEDGAFTGSTICFVLNEFAKRNVTVSVVVLGFAFPAAMDRIRSNFKGDVVVIENLEGTKIVDWMPDHDFVPFTPNCGRVFGLAFDGEATPYYSRAGATFCFPYIAPFGDVEGWASVPTTDEGRFSSFCSRSAAELYYKIEQMNGGKKILIKDLLHSCPSVSVPIRINDRKAPCIDMWVNDYLRESRSGLM